MIILRYRFNCMLVTLPEFGEIQHEVVPVLLRDGDFERVAWGGYVDIEEIRQRYKHLARPVKLDIVEYSVSPGEHWPIWRRVPDGAVVQGAIISGKAFGVVENGLPRLIEKHRSKQSGC